ncbi:MAG: hypothetical protein ACM3O6_00855 [Acidobacteriota bacterium]
MSAAQAPATTPCSAPDLIAVSGALADLLERETAELAAMRLDAAARLKDEKTRLARRYRAQLEELRAGRIALGDAPESLRAEIAASATRLAAAAAENERALRAGRAAVERVIAAIANAVVAGERRVRAYAPPRHAPGRLSGIGGLAVDRRL